MVKYGMMKVPNKLNIDDTISMSFYPFHQVKMHALIWHTN